MILNPASDDIAKIRLKTGDTSEPYLLEEQIYQYILDKNNQDIYASTVEALESIVASFAKLVDEKVGDEEARWSDAYRQYSKLLSEYKNNPSFIGEWLPYAGGISNADIKANNADTDNNRTVIKGNSFNCPDSSIWSR